jgi:hypothetical protein
MPLTQLCQVLPTRSRTEQDRATGRDWLAFHQPAISDERRRNVKIPGKEEYNTNDFRLHLVKGGPSMKPLQYLCTAGSLFALVSIVGCITGPADRVDTSGSAISQQSLGDKAFQYRRQAGELREMARRLEMEAEWYAQLAGQESEQAKHARDMAKSFWATAEEADDLARQYQSQVPHGQVYH